MSKQKRFQELFISLLAEKWWKAVTVGGQVITNEDLPMYSMAQEAFAQLDKEEKIAIEFQERMNFMEREHSVKSIFDEEAEAKEFVSAGEMLMNIENPDHHICRCGVIPQKHWCVKTCPDAKCQPKEEEKQECACHSKVDICGKRTAKSQPPEKEEPYFSYRWLKERISKVIDDDLGAREKIEEIKQILNPTK